MADTLILVPLDGSAPSERALAYAEVVARAAGARLLLAGVWEGPDDDLSNMFPAAARELTDQGTAEVRSYLEGVAARLRNNGFGVEVDVRAGHPADEIIAIIADRDPELLVLSTHGRSGLGRWVYGSVASKLVREAPVATLAVGPKVLAQKEAAIGLKRILVPLDGSNLSEIALAPASELAVAADAELLLAEVLSFSATAFGFGVPAVNVAQLDRDLTGAAEDYLKRVCDRLKAKVRVKGFVVHGMSPAEALSDLEKTQDVDLVVMASHTRRGVARAVLGSVADRMLQGSVPVLLVRPERSQTVVEPAETGRYCHACGRGVPYAQLLPDDRCLRCGRHLHVCGNCVYFDGVGCLLQRSELHDTPPGMNCPLFQFRETAPPALDAAGQA